MKKNGKNRLFEVFEKVNKVNLKEWYDDEYYEKPKKTEEIDPNNIRQIIELHTYLTQDGIADIYDVFSPRWIIDELKNNGFIEELDFTWFFTDEGVQKFPTPQDFQKWLLSVGGDSTNDSETPHLRGGEDSNVSF